MYGLNNMAIPFVVLKGELDKATRVRLAIIGGSSTEKAAREITMDDIESCWPMLIDSGYCAIDILNFANNKVELADEAFTSIMKALNSYL